LHTERRLSENAGAASGTSRIARGDFTSVDAGVPTQMPTARRRLTGTITRVPGTRGFVGDPSTAYVND
jgi:hypothetical protein